MVIFGDAEWMVSLKKTWSNQGFEDTRIVGVRRHRGWQIHYSQVIENMSHRNDQL